MLSNKPEIYIPLPHIFNVNSTTNLLKDLLEILLDKNLKLVYFDIMNMYSNVPARNLLEIMGLICNQNGINKELKYATTKFCKILTKQNYFQYIQEDGLAMGTPTSSIFLKYTYSTLKTQRYLIFW